MPILSIKPWQRSQECVKEMPRGMLGAVEGALLYHITKDYYRGYGKIIDAGAFLGASSYCLAKGLEDNSRIGTKAGRLHVYDLFEVWLEQDTTEKYMASELKNAFGIDVANGETTFWTYISNLGPLARYIQVHAGDITKMNWEGRPIEILFLDICKNKAIWTHVLNMFYPSLIPGVSLVIHQDYHHPLLPFIHVVQERLSPYFEIADAKSDDSATFLLKEMIPDRVLNEVSGYDFDFTTEMKLMDKAIERLAGNNEHLLVAKCQLLRQRGRATESRQLLDRLKDVADRTADTKLSHYIAFVDILLCRDEARIIEPPPEFNEDVYLAVNPDIDAAVKAGRFESGFHHWVAFGRNGGRALS